MRDIFYYGSIKKYITAFGMLFKDIRYYDDFGREVVVPLFYSPKEKFLTEISEGLDPDENPFDVVLPRIGFEMTGLNPAPERALNPLQTMSNPQKMASQQKFMRNRVAWDFSFSVYFATKKFEDSLRIAEQILPFFSPAINLTLRDMDEFEIENDIPIVLNSCSFITDYLGSFDNRRKIDWEMQFTMKAFLYSEPVIQNRIKQSIVELKTSEVDSFFEQYIASVDPMSAERTDPHVIIEEVRSIGPDS